jgi:hypothetical protein
MRSPLTFVVMAAVLVVVLAWLVVPAVANGVAGQVLGASLGGQVQVHVESSFPPRLVLLQADAVHVTGTDLTIPGGQVTAGALDIDLHDVDLLARTAASVTGALTDVTVSTGSGGAPMQVARIDLAGPSDAIETTMTVAASEVEARAADEVAAAIGTRPSAVTLEAPDLLRMTVGGIQVDARLVVEGGDLRARLTGLPIAALTLVPAASTGALQLTGTHVSGGDLVIVGRLDPKAIGL